MNVTGVNTKWAYITEPEHINPQLLDELLAGSGYRVVAGDTSFKGSHERPYEALFIRSNTRVNASVGTYFPHLRSVVRVGVGLDNIDRSFCEAHGIRVFNAPGANADAVSDYVVGIIIMALRKFYVLTNEDITTWNRFKFIGHTVSDQIVGIIGFGNIGKRVQAKLSSFSCKEFLVYDPLLSSETVLPENTRPVSLEELLRQSTVISLHVPLLPETKYIIGQHNIALLQNDAVVINTARGGVVEEEAMLSAVKAKGLIYAADTVEGEPTVNSHLLESKNIIITPHIGSLTDKSERDMLQLAAENFLSNRIAVM